ncbi:hypothetical protein LSAT2_010967 [Lamellibrachia satsuma]|nr:hypothetical protein LSAT2_010967 [Lamellibrachia satsuma]
MTKNVACVRPCNPSSGESVNDTPTSGSNTQSSPPTFGDTSEANNPTNVGPTAVYTIQPTATVTTVRPKPLRNPPNDGFGFSICVMLCCCCPLGFMGCIKSSECQTAIKNGDREKAEKLSKESFIFSVAGLVIGIISIITIYFVQLK